MTRLCVYLHGELSPRGLSQYLSEKLPGVKVEAFGQFKDFQRSLSRSPDVVLALPPALTGLGLTPRRPGIRDGKRSETYVLMSLQELTERRQVSKLGLVGLFGRVQLRATLAQMLGVRPSLRIAVQLDDLLSMLRFKLVPAVFVPEAQVAHFRSMTEQPLYSIAVGRLALPALAEPGGQALELSQRLRSLPAEAKTVLGVDGWQ